MGIPRKFRLAGLDFKVVFVDNIKNGEDYGHYLDVSNTIELANRIKTDDEWFDIPDAIKQNTFYHELFHIFNYYWNTEFDESLAQVFANFMVEFVQTAEYGII